MRYAIMLSTNGAAWNVDTRGALADSIKHASELMFAVDLPCVNPECSVPSHATLLLTGEPELVRTVHGLDGYDTSVALVAQLLTLLPDILTEAFGDRVVDDAIAMVAEGLAAGKIRRALRDHAEDADTN